jgi:hypothetical protein
MSADRTYVSDNDTERARLQALVARLSDADLARPMPAGWTIAAVLSHLAFWDQRVVVLLDQWQQSPSAEPRVEIARDVDWINDAAKPMMLALDPRRAAEQAVAIATEADRRVAAMSDALIARNAALGGPLNLRRSEHRREHLGEIEAALRG